MRYMIRGFFRRSLHLGASRSPLPFLSSPHSILTSNGGFKRLCGHTPIPSLFIGAKWEKPFKIFRKYQWATYACIGAEATLFVGHRWLPVIYLSYKWWNHWTHSGSQQEPRFGRGVPKMSTIDNLDLYIEKIGIKYRNLKKIINILKGHFSYISLK